jgi:hypothetical protein
VSEDSTKTPSRIFVAGGIVVETVNGLFTVGVFQDVAWADKGVQALRAHGFLPEVLSLIAKDSPDTAALAERTFGQPARTLEIRGVGPVRCQGTIVSALQGADEGLAREGIAASARRIGFQPHDGRIFETLVARGGVLVAVMSEAKAADALALLHSYGGGNAAIGAWGGRV